MSKKEYIDKDQLFELVYPIGSIYLSASAISPDVLFGIGVWEQIKDRFLLSAGNTHAVGSMGGAETVALSTSQVPNVSGKIQLHAQAVATDVHNVSGCFSSGITNNAYVTGNDGVAIIKTGATSVGTIQFDNGGTGATHDNMPPYLVVYMWKRIN